MATQFLVNMEGTTLGVYAREEHDVDELLLLLEVLTVEDQTVVNDLADQADGRLGAEDVEYSWGDDYSGWHNCDYCSCDYCSYDSCDHCYPGTISKMS